MNLFPEEEVEKDKASTLEPGIPRPPKREDFIKRKPRPQLITEPKEKGKEEPRKKPLIAGGAGRGPPLKEEDR